jgi:TonB family protein
MPEIDKPLRVGGDVRPPVKISGNQARYTELARRARLQGVVILELIVDRTGKVTDARVLQPLPMGLDKAAIDAVITWKYQPATFRGEPVAVYYNVKVEFRLDR